MKEIGRYDNLLNRVLEPLHEDKSSLCGEVFRLLFIISFNDLKRAGNPLEHYLIVLEHMIEIAEGEDFTNSEMIHACSIAILHDIAPVEKIREADIGAKELEDDEKRVLEQRRRQNRTLHMREGSVLAQRKLLLLNDYLGRIFYKDRDIDTICEIIRIHDNPSIDTPIPKENHLASAFREADRLWMLSSQGFAYDLQKDMQGIKEPISISLLASRRLNHILKRFQEERNLYSVDDGPFQDSLLFFRTKAGHDIFLRYLHERIDQYGLHLNNP